MPEVCDHPLSSEQQILSELSSGPLHVKEIIERTGLPETTVRDNLKSLKTAGKVKSGEVGSYHFYVLPGDTLPLSSEQQILSELSSGPLHIKEIIERTGLPQATVSRNLIRLETAGKVKSRKIGSYHFYALPRDTLPLLTLDQQQILSELSSGPLHVKEISERTGLSKITVWRNLKRLKTARKVKSSKVGDLYFYALPGDTFPGDTFPLSRQQQILSELSSGPLHVKEIIERTDLPRTTVYRNLKRLETARKVKSSKVGDLYFYALPSVVSEDTRQQILSELSSGPLYVKEIIERTGLPRTTVRYHLKSLKTDGKVKSSKVGDLHFYALPGDTLPLSSQQQILSELSSGPLYVKEIIERTGLSDATVMSNLKSLKTAKKVKSGKVGDLHFYALPGDTLPLSSQQQILSELSSGPLYVKEIIERTGLPRTTVWNNLKSLKTDGKVKSSKVGDLHFYALSKDTLPLSRQQQILSELSSGPLYVKEISERTGLSKTAVSDNLKSLKTARKVKRSKVGNLYFYALSNDTLPLSSQQQILKSLESGPLYVKEIIERTGLSRKTVSDNLKSLKTAGKVKIGKVGDLHFYALPGSTLPLLTPNQRNILKSLESGPLHVSKICKLTGLSWKIVSDNLKRLETAGMVEDRGKVGTHHLYALLSKEFEETLPPLSVSEQKILNFLKSGPLHVSKICKLMDLSWITVMKNLKRLETAGMVEDRGKEGSHHFYALPSMVPEDTLRPLFLNQQKILNSLESGLLHIKEISERTDLPRTTVYRNLKRLETARKVKSRKIGSYHFYALPRDTLPLLTLDQQQILSELSSGPLHVKEISERTGLSRDTIHSNLKKLETAGKVKRGKVGNCHFYALPGDTLPLFLPSKQKILESLASGNHFVYQICGHTGLSQRVVYRNLKGLETISLVENRGRKERHHEYVLSDDYLLYLDSRGSTLEGSWLKEFEETLPPLSVSEQKILKSLESGKLLVEQICRLTGLSQTTVDHDLNRLMSLELVDKGRNHEYVLSDDYLLYLDSKGPTLEGSWPTVLRALIRARNSGLSPTQIDGVPLEMVLTILEKWRKDGMVKIHVEKEKRKTLYTLTPRGMQMAAKQNRFSP